MQQIGRYEIKREIGRGGMAVVYLAFDPRVERNVALKVLPPRSQLDTDLRNRFEREAKIIASLEHPAIVPIYDYGEHEGQPYLVMRYMSGGGLDERIAANKRLPLAYIALILERIGSALDIAHERGVVHRDLKPSNILLDQYNNPFLCDFGIVKLIKRVATNWQTSTIVGTPAYMSPEQARGARVDWRSDIYGLGVVLFEMLTGRTPYNADSITGLLFMQMEAPVPQLQDLAPELSPVFQPIVNQAMAKEPASRFPSASAIAGAFAGAVRQADTAGARTVADAAAEETHIESPPEGSPEPEQEESAPTPVVRWRPLDIDIPAPDEEDGEAPAGHAWRQLDDG
ncbi:MAG: protein kinase [Chloroflexi bacterium]|nr:protein kinase [Chloroflexota bacterium]